ncbi:MAG: hypothetical protein J07HB67_01116 [halophilic archaeon J07HB67]|nr:MAG: hypothetical protein J07HB67_01116 [halophilic archaeon J07HB67]
MLRLAASVLSAIVFVAVLRPMSGYTGQMLGWEPLAPVLAAAIVLGRLAYGAYQVATAD